VETTSKAVISVWTSDLEDLKDLIRKMAKVAVTAYLIGPIIEDRGLVEAYSHLPKVRELASEIIKEL
jgi:hypothetical protein